MDELKTEEEQLQALRDWWKENGYAALLGVAVGLGAVFGWRAWQTHQVLRAEAASALFQQALNGLRQSEPDKAAKGAAEVRQQYPDTPYAVFAALTQAKLAADASDLDAAAGHLRFALDKTSDPVLKKEIRLRLARVLAAQTRYDDALALLDPANAGAYQAAYDELRGDIESGRGNREAARAAYERALSQPRSERADADVLQAKLNALGPKPAA